MSDLVRADLPSWPPDAPAGYEVVEESWSYLERMGLEENSRDLGRNRERWVIGGL